MSVPAASGGVPANPRGSRPPGPLRFPRPLRPGPPTVVRRLLRAPAQIPARAGARAARTAVRPRAIGAGAIRLGTVRSRDVVRLRDVLGLRPAGLGADLAGRRSPVLGVAALRSRAARPQVFRALVLRPVVPRADGLGPPELRPELLRPRGVRHPVRSRFRRGPEGRFEPVEVVRAERGGDVRGLRTGAAGDVGPACRARELRPDQQAGPGVLGPPGPGQRPRREAIPSRAPPRAVAARGAAHPARNPRHARLSAPGRRRRAARRRRVAPRCARSRW